MMAKAIDRGSKYGLRMVDMPYWSFHVSKEQAVANAGRFCARGQRRSNEVRRQPASRARISKRSCRRAFRSRATSASHRCGCRSSAASWRRARRRTAGEGAGGRREGLRGRRLLLDPLRGHDLGSRRVSGANTAGTGDQSRRRKLRARRAHYFIRPVSPLGRARAAPFAHLHRSHPHHGGRVSRYMADVRSRNYPGPKETVFMESRRAHEVRQGDEVGEEARRDRRSKKRREAGRSSRRSHGPPQPHADSPGTPMSSRRRSH